MLEWTMANDPRLGFVVEGISPTGIGEGARILKRAVA
jgi:hypothetical protein